ncbi:DUF6461 domain-containing protein [Streptomyces sp. NBC_00055]|uniref:DUF6461 domain-containing protein n=1 Tax=unclassified Streptomyces TaxID=2593676 RepID=UPI00386ACFB5
MHFDLSDPGYRTGSTPDELPDLIHHPGFEIPEEPRPTDDHPPAAVALARAEHLTRVRLTPELPQNTTCSSAVPNSGEPTTALSPQSPRTCPKCRGRRLPGRPLEPCPTQHQGPQTRADACPHAIWDRALNITP